MAEVIDRDSTSSPGSPMNGASFGASTEDERADLTPAGRGWLLEEPRERRLVRFLWSRWDQWEDEAGEWHARWKASRWRRAGLTGVVVTRPTSDDRTAWGVYAPPGTARLAPAFNQAARLCRQLKSNVWADPPVPEPVPASAGDDDALNAAEFSGRLLRSLDHQPPTDLIQRMKTAFDMASTYDSGFLLIEVDPHGGGHRPATVEASVYARTVEEATHVVRPNPETGEMEEVPQPPPFVERYVAEDGVTLVDDVSQAKLEWLPGLRALALNPYKVRPTEKGATDVEDAEGILVARFQTLGELRKKYPKLRDLPFGVLRRLCEFEPEGESSRYLPAGVRQRRKLTTDDLANRYGRSAPDDDGDGLEDYGDGDPVSMAGMLRRAAAEQGLGRDEEEDDGDERDPEDIPDDIHVFTLTLYQRGHTRGYPWGAEVCIAGDSKSGRVLGRRELAGERDGRKEVLPIPLAQAKQFSEGLDSFYGVGAMQLLGPGNEARATFVQSLVEHLDRFNRRKVFYDPSSLFQPKAANAAMGTYVPVAKGSEPRVEQVPNYPREGVEMFQLADLEMRDELGFGSPVAQGKTDPSVKSALHAATIMEQVVVNLSDIKQYTERFVTRTWKITLALAWAHFTSSQTLQYFGDDQSYKAEDWSGSDIGLTRDVRIMRSSFTMLAPSAKLQVAEYALQLGLIDHFEMQRIFGGNYGADVGVQDNPHLMRVRRQINAFWKGRTGDFVPAAQDEMGQQTPEQGGVFRDLPSDLEPAFMTPLTAASEQAGSAGRQAGIPPAPLGGVAMLRARELSRAMAEERYERMMISDPEWAQHMAAAYDRARRAAGIQFAHEIAQAQQAAAEAAQQAQAAEQEAAQQELQMRQAESEIKLQGEQAKTELDLQRGQQEIALDAAAGQQDMALTAARGRLDLTLAAERGKLDLELQRKKAAAQASGQAAARRARPGGDPAK